MLTLTYTITTSTRTNEVTGLSGTIKKVVPSIDGAELRHSYTFGGSVTDADAKAAVKADLESDKGYGALIEA